MKWALPEADKYFAPLLAQDPRGFQIDHLELALSHCSKFGTAIDGGAHIGTWTVRMAQKFAKVMAFEPAVDTFRCLSENVFDLDNVDLFQTALGAVRCSGKIVDDLSRPGNTGARHLNLSAGGDVEVMPIDDFSLDDLDFLKLDVEGYELHALQGALETLQRCRPVVLIEVKKFRPPRFGVEVESASKFLVAQGFREIAAVRNDRIFVWANQ